MTDSLISVVVPVYNEFENIDLLYKRVTAAMKSIGYPYEVIVSDNCSTDGTREKLRRITHLDRQWKAIFLSRNFGHQNSLLCALSHANGEAVISLDGDLQDPPEAIPRLIAEWENGADVVTTVRSKRPGENPLRMLFIHTYYKIMGFLSGNLLTSNSGDFRLLSRRALNELLKLKECSIYIRGLIPLIGFNQVKITYEREGRGKRGRSKMNFFRLSSFALDGLTSTTMVPLRLSLVMGLVSLVASLGYGARVLYLYFFSESSIPGWTTLTLLLLVYGGAILMMLGIVGEYLGRVFYEVKERPRFIVGEVVEAPRVAVTPSPDPIQSENERPQPVQ